MRTLAALVTAAAAALVIASSATSSFHGLAGRIAFDRPHDTNVEIYAIDPDGSNVQNLSNHAGGDHDPATRATAAGSSSSALATAISRSTS
jgi:hypothetical protein